ncbi:hypothetical protein RhiirC2_727170 [Rhizophagus irregularis]|uniref:Uncharacterized protein n=1 Tax=Rhizophagus irregularis TaxID=588596 RepID=A0A2N1P062_9GLOM|nr:hypothetical protein RhiirC2_727170 [Rhizophagus irregularis]
MTGIMQEDPFFLLDEHFFDGKIVSSKYSKKKGNKDRENSFFIDNEVIKSYDKKVFEKKKRM